MSSEENEKSHYCSECGKHISSFGGSFVVDGKTLCSKCESRYRMGEKDGTTHKIKEIKNLRNNLREKALAEQSSSDMKLLTLIESVELLNQQQSKTNRTLSSIKGYLLFFVLMYIMWEILSLIVAIGTY